MKQLLISGQTVILGVIYTHRMPRRLNYVYQKIRRQKLKD